MSNLEVVFTLQGHTNRKNFQSFVSAMEADLSQMRIENLILSSQTTRVREQSNNDLYFQMEFAITAR